MKRVITALIIVSTISGCSLIEDAQGTINDGITSYENVTEEINGITTTYTETKDKVVETIDDVNNAIDKVQEAKEALEKITE